ncbi:MAG: hypothetical protein M1833_001402 [Piccolia ochrophora]|nr:MAG: hypothetical protein M1833_001402 [Piccolia ochrophora]
MFESGTLNIDPMELLPVMAICSGDSIFVAGEMLSDPAENHPRFYIRRIVGNIGRPGITMMVAPQNPRVRCASDDYRAVTHALYDNNTEDNFQGTSLHLSFTNFKMPMATGSFGYIDQDVFFIESIVSVHDRGDWVADLDVLAAMSDDVKRSSRCHCGHPTSTFKGAMTSIDSWDELLDPPENAGIVRAHDNWAARLAAYCVLRQRGLAPKAVVVRSNVTCWNCVEKQKAMFYID